MATPVQPPITDAASVLLSRGSSSINIYLVRRADILRFFGGFVAFPGGKVADEDAVLAQTVPGCTARHVAACRELFEEIGVLLARDTAGGFPSSGPELVDARRALNTGEVSFADLLSRRGLRVVPEDLTFAGTLVTPPFSPIRFATGFYVASLPLGQTPEVWPGELSAGFWRSADAALGEWTAGELLLSPPTVSLLELIRGRPLQELPERLQAVQHALATDRIPLIWFHPGVLMIPLFSHGLPPSTHTNAFLVGTDKPHLIDPGPPHADEQDRLWTVLDDVLGGRRLAGVLLTHHHPDHIGAARASAARYGAPVLAHPLTARLLAEKVAVDRVLEDGAHLDLGQAPDGSGPWRLEMIHTPGHAPGHLCLWEPRYRLLFAGDMVSTLSSIIIAPPEGDLAVYLASIRRLQQLPARLLLPSHGSPSSRPAFLLDAALAHRAKREQQILDVLTAGPQRMETLATEIYRGLPANLMRLGELQLLAGLIKLKSEGRVLDQTSDNGAMWELAPSH